MGRISQAGAAFSEGRKIDVMTKNISVGKPTPGATSEATPSNESPAPVEDSVNKTDGVPAKEKEIKSEEAQEND